MTRRQTLRRGTFAFAAVLLLVAGSDRLSQGADGKVGSCIHGCSPTTPCPCAADGVCRPKRDSWGHYKTRWRAWPGETSGQEPTLATPDETEESTLDELPPYQTPPPEQEDLRVPAKDKKKAGDEEGEATEMQIELPGELPGEALPGPGIQPAPGGAAEPDDFDPFSQQPGVPLDDAPPALPPSLRQAAAAMGMPVMGSPRVAQQIRPAAMHQAPLEQPTATPAMPVGAVQQASFQSSPGIQLINPASAVVEPAATPLQQAIYYEASDRNE